MRLELNLSKREAEAVLRCELSNGRGVIRSQALRAAEFKLKDAILRARREAEPQGEDGRDA